jgi:hypothetical protein
MKKYLPTLAGFLIALLTLFTLPWRYCAYDWKPIYSGELAALKTRSDGVYSWIEADQGGTATGSTLFDAEWLFGSSMMAAMGFGQLAWQYPELKAESLSRMDACIERLKKPELQAFDAHSWGEAPLKNLEGSNGHMGYLGYFGLVLALRTVIEPEHPNKALYDSVIMALQKRFQAAPFGLVETYPNEAYPLDNLTGLAALGLAQKNQGAIIPVIATVLEHYKSRYLKNGLLVQAVDPTTGEARDYPRGSGTFLGAWLLSFVDPHLAETVYLSAHNQLYGTLFGFGMMREYPPEITGWGDIDSGPVILGYGISATGFALAGARQWKDQELFLRIGATATLFGTPVQAQGQHHFLMGGPIGDAILFAMGTAVPGGIK